ncbi:unnamed protein product [Oikopleura dioica]|uniref:Uncharacterized protein n=1 Tax=Oikopleura dioica TaxID=34765 RepID=E4YHK4_OIKDI|nr:unnamed protein product [Oikopleura dioica]
MDRNGKKENPKSEIKDIFREVTRQIVEQTTRTRFNSALFADDSSDAELSVSYSDIEEEVETNETSLTESGRLSTTRRSYRLARAAKSTKSPAKASTDLNQTHPLTRSTNGEALSSQELHSGESNNNLTMKKSAKTSESQVKSEKSVKEKFKDAKKAVSKRLGFSGNHKSGSSSKSASATMSPKVHKSAERKVKSGARISEVHQTSGNTDKKRLSDIVQRTISRHQSRHPTRNPTSENTRAVTRSQSTNDNKKKPRKKTSERVEQHLVEAAQILSDNVQGVYGRQPSSSTYELPLEKKFDEEFSMKDFASGPSSKVSSRASRNSSQTSNSSNERQDQFLAPMPLNSRTISASEDIVPPTPASVSTSRPQSSLFTFDEGEIQLNTAIDDEAERRRQEAINSITNDLIAISNTPQFQDATSNLQTDLRKLFAPNANTFNQENAYRRLMAPLKNVLQQASISQESLVETLIASARIIAYIPSLARFIWSYITSTLNLSIEDLNKYAQNNDEESDSDDGTAV